MERITERGIRELKDLCQRGDYESIVALLSYRIEEETEKALISKDDHRFLQGSVFALRSFLGDIVRKR